MSFQIFSSGSADRALKKFSPKIRKYIFDEIKKLADNPELGLVLRGEFRRYRSLHLKLNNTQYRVIYFLDHKKNCVLILYAATRENFYQELKRLI